TWVAKGRQRSPVNTEAKYLMLRHAFETMGAMRVELKTDRLNRASRNAILRIGAKYEGTFRKHMTTASGRIRDTVYYSIVDQEWPRVKAALERMLAGATEGPVPIDGLTGTQVVELHAMFQKEWWTRGRTLEGVERLLEGSDVIVAFCDPATRRLIAFARVVTDFVYKALVLDVIVEESWRGRGLGARLMDSVVNHAVLDGVKHFELYCKPELAGFYQRWGFAETPPELRFLRLART
ncbi:MAG: GNAT family N-acetyltransferase, partial [Vicinamibacterales bacterium]